MEDRAVVTTLALPMASDGPPLRAALCLDCRTALVHGETCDAGKRHRVVSLEDRQGRERLLTEVWGPPSMRRRARELARAGGGGAGLSLLFEGSDLGCSVAGWALEIDLVAMVVTFAAIGTSLVYWLVAKVVEAVRRNKNALKPNGALALPAALPASTRRIGVVLPHANLQASPLSRTPCVAFSVLFRNRKNGGLISGRGVMLHDAATVGFDVALADGQRVRIPPGRLRMPEPREKVDPTPAAIALYCHQLNSAHAAEELDPMPADELFEEVVRPGDRLEILGELEVRSDPEAPPLSYRESPPMLLVPVGIPAVRVQR